MRLFRCNKETGCRKPYPVAELLQTCAEARHDVNVNSQHPDQQYPKLESSV